MADIAFGSSDEASQTECIQALVVEFIATFLFVFVGVASCMYAEKHGGDQLLVLFVVGMAHAFVTAVMISAAHISGGHLNPAVTLGLLIGGHITVFRSMLYWIDQILASTTACYLLYFLTGQLTPVHTLAVGVGTFQGITWEIVLTFGLLFTVYATMVDPKKGSNTGIGPVLVGFVVGANIIAGGGYSAASMNPARSFGPALVSGNWTDHWIYWVGPLSGAALAGYVYETFFIDRSHVLLLRVEDN
ncbi:unnamed protein product [Sphenostylis stenocarpa]|uniref:Aquaporin TIP4-1 n=1 Tax=Sphenostylis stenocarpa TaxID=92480 RepID=A0AA86SW42_9FABA|nr:unnamed protein product [Sphenostylis stenocarpa]